MTLYCDQMPLIFDHPRAVPSGHHFLDPSGYTIKGKTLRELLENIAAYRITNGLLLGNPAAEVEAYYAVTFPWLISSVGSTPAVVADPVVRWVNRIWRDAPKSKEFAESQKTSARMATCRNCEHYVPEHPFSADSSRRLLILGAGKYKTMGACRVHHWACGMAVLIEQPDVAVKVGGCWAI